MGEITLPNDWRPRPHQRKLWLYFERGGGRAVAVWHRRAGKDSLALNLAAVKAHQRTGIYWHLLPQARQGRKVIWDGIDRLGRRMVDQAFPPELRRAVDKQEMKIELKCGSIWQVVGSDNYNALVGANPVGVVFSEYSLADPAAWDYLRPILAENGGWALFIYTARGRNHGARMFHLAQRRPDWFAEILTVEDTGIIGPEALAEERASGMSEEMIQQEYFCSFEAAIVGSYYGPQLAEAERQKRIGRVPWEPQLPVHTWWDLGIGDATAIWFVQLHGREVRLIDYYEASGVGLDHYAKVLLEKPYVYGEHRVPHDAAVRELGTGLSRLETLRSLGIRAGIGGRQKVEDGINAARMILPRCWFDAERCARGIEALRQYRKDWDETRRIFRDRPLHDWTSHAADAFRYGAQELREPRGAGLRQVRAIEEDRPRGGFGQAARQSDAVEE